MKNLSNPKKMQDIGLLPKKFLFFFIEKEVMIEPMIFKMLWFSVLSVSVGYRKRI